MEQNISLIATLPTLRNAEDLTLVEKIFRHPRITSARYNTGGSSPFSPVKILEKLKPIADKHGKTLYVDLEGRQVRVGRWTPHSAGKVVLNQKFGITLPGQVYFRGAGWFEIVGAGEDGQTLFFRPKKMRQEYFLGESQSVHIVAKELEVQGSYLSGRDSEYIKAAAQNDINAFMLSFVEHIEDIAEFSTAHSEQFSGKCPKTELIAKIESVKGIEFVSMLSPSLLQEFGLMAARDDLFLSYVRERKNFLSALRTIVEKDPRAIVASKIMSGLERGGEVSMGDMADMVLMHQYGYRSFMLADEVTDSFEDAMEDWENIMLPLFI